MVTITISGTPGSGKSTVAKLLEKKLGIKYIYSGKLFREMAKKHNMTLEEFGRFCEKNKEIDNKLDEKQIKLLKKGGIILEGRLAGWFAYKNKIPAFKILLDTNLETRAERIVNREGGDVEKRKKEIIERERSEKKRYKKYYNIDLDDTSIYDIVVDTGDKKPDEIVEMILDEMKEKQFL